MAKIGSRKWGTPFKKPPTQKSKATRIIIPQPTKFPFYIKGTNVIRWEDLTSDPQWYVLHRRGVQEVIQGIDPREERAVPESQIKGSLPERIVYKYLVAKLMFVPDVDFDFQSANEGGRVELGGFVVDFLFPILKLVIQVQGVTHKQYLQGKKDEQQFDILAEFGYKVEEIEDTEIYDEYRFENRMRRIFNLASAVGSSFGGYSTPFDETPAPDPDINMHNDWLADIHYINSVLDSVV